MSQIQDLDELLTEAKRNADALTAWTPLVPLLCKIAADARADAEWLEQHLAQLKRRFPRRRSGLGWPD